MTGRVLVVEHKPAIKKQLRKLLRGHHVEFAESGPAALKAARESKPGVILMDIELPNSSGFEISGELLARRETREIPVLFLNTTPEEANEPEEPPEFIVGLADLVTLGQRIKSLLEESEGARAFKETYWRILAGQTAHRVQELSESESDELAEGGFPVNATVDPQPIAQRAAEYAELVNSSLSTAQAAARLGVNTSRVRQRLLDQPPTLYGIRKDNEWILPDFQFQKKGLVPDIDKVISRLDSGLDLVAVYRWFTRPNPDLIHENKATSPLDWLLQGLSWRAVASLAGDLSS